MSVAGGLDLAFERIARVKGQALQIFTRNQRQWRSPELTDKAVELFRAAWKENGRMPVAAHASYLVNLATSDSELAEKSVQTVADELVRAERLGAHFLVLHPGSYGDGNLLEGMDRFARNLDLAVALSGSNNVMTLLENTAGQGSGLGWRFEQLAYILSNSGYSRRLGVCFDTCHAFAAGYNIGSPDEYLRTFEQFDSFIGLDRLRFFHVNDSKRELGSHVDRHTHIGKGQIGLEAFRLLLNDPRFARHPMTLETPKGKDLAEDKVNLKTLRGLIV